MTYSYIRIESELGSIWVYNILQKVRCFRAEIGFAQPEIRIGSKVAAMNLLLKELSILYPTFLKFFHDKSSPFPSVLPREISSTTGNNLFKKTVKY